MSRSPGFKPVQARRSSGVKPQVALETQHFRVVQRVGLPCEVVDLDGGKHAAASVLSQWVRPPAPANRSTAVRARWVRPRRLLTAWPFSHVVRRHALAILVGLTLDAGLERAPSCGHKVIARRAPLI